MGDFGGFKTSHETGKKEQGWWKSDFSITSQSETTKHKPALGWYDLRLKRAMLHELDSLIFWIIVKKD